MHALVCWPFNDCQYSKNPDSLHKYLTSFILSKNIINFCNKLSLVHALVCWPFNNCQYSKNLDSLHKYLTSFILSKNIMLFNLLHKVLYQRNFNHGIVHSVPRTHNVATFLKHQHTSYATEIFESNLSFYMLYYAIACNEYAGPIFVSLGPGNTAHFEEILQRWQAAGNTESTSTSPRFEPQTYRSKDKRVIAVPLGWT